MHEHDLARISHRLLHIEDELKRVSVALTELKEMIVALADDLKAGIAKLDTETTAIGDLIKALANKVKNSMSDQEVTDLKTSLGSLSDRLTTLAVDPTNPVPPVTPGMTAAKKVAGKP